MFLNNRQTVRQARHKKVSNLLSTNQTLTDAYAPLKNTSKTYKKLIETVDPAATVKGQSTTGITETRKTGKGEFARQYELICSAGFLFCSDEANNFTELLPEFDFTEAKIRVIPQNETMPFAQKVNGKVTKLIALPAFADYGVKQADLDKGLERGKISL